MIPYVYAIQTKLVLDKKYIRLLGSFDSVCSEVDEASFARHHVGKTAEGLSIQEVCIARKFFTRIPLRNCENKHPLICGLTRQQTKQYSW